MIAYQIITSSVILRLKNKEGFMEYFKGTGIYLIKEQIYTKSGLPSIANTIGPTSIQVVKSVYHLMREQELFYNDSPVNYSNVNTWGKFKISFGIGISEKDKKNGKLIFNLEYCGFSTFITPIDGFDRILPRWLSSKHKISAPTPYKFGRDPISSVNLYGNIRSKFFIENSGDGAPVSLAGYNSKTKDIIYINSEIEFISIAKKLMKIK